MTAALSIAVELDELPDGLRFDGTMEIPDGRLLQFTELDKSRASYGASFYVDSKSALLDAILSRREEKRVEFAAGCALRDARSGIGAAR